MVRFRAHRFLPSRGDRKAVGEGSLPAQSLRGDMLRSKKMVGEWFLPVGTRGSSQIDHKNSSVGVLWFAKDLLKRFMKAQDADAQQEYR